MKTMLLTSLFALSLFFGYAQNTRRDSLKHELAISKPDTHRVMVLVQLINSYKFDIPDSAFFYGQKAVALARQMKFPKGEAQALFFLAGTYSALGNSSNGLELDFKSLQIANKNNLIKEKADALMHIGNHYAKSQNFPKALIYLHQALNLSDSNTAVSSKFLTLNSIVFVFLEMNKLDSAEYYSKLTAGDLKQHKQGWMRAEYLRTVWKLYYKKGETQQALDFLGQSLIDDSTSSLSSRPNYEIAKIYQQISLMDSAIYYGQKSLDIAQRSTSYSNIITASKLLAQLYESKDAQKAIQYNKIAIAAQDSLNNFAKTNAFKNITEFDEKERQYEIDTAKTVFKNQTRQYALLAGICVFVLIAFILFRNNRHKQKAYALLQNQKQETEKAYEQLKATQSQLIQSEKMASLGELTAGIAHEIQNPLNFVNNFSEVSADLVEEMKEELLMGNNQQAISISNDLKENLVKITHHGRRADAIVKGMLQHSQTSPGYKELTDINALADEYLRLSYHGLRAKDKNFNADFKTDFDDTIGKIAVVKQDIGRVLLNIYNNAFYAASMPSERGFKDPFRTHQPTVWVTTSKLPPSGGGGAVISVRDNGPGIPSAILDKIFQPFFTTKPTGQGTGLGLSLSYDIVKAHGGGVSVESKEGEGTTFIIQLPKL